MNQKQIGAILIITGVIIAAFVFFAKAKEDAAINLIIHERNSCYLDDGTCLHEDRDLTIYIVGWILSGALILLGIYLAFFDKTQKLLAEHQVKVSAALNEASRKDEFNAFLAAFDKDEQNILKAIKDQEGIQQSTLRYKTGISKTKLSLLLKSLEERDIIKRKVSGNTNEVFLRKKF